MRYLEKSNSETKIRVEDARAGRRGEGSYIQNVWGDDEKELGTDSGEA